MNVLIIEDELLAQEKLAAMLKEIDPSINIVGVIESVTMAINWLSQHPSPDVAFADIQLADDHSFEIFKKTNVNFPVIFVTAYDKYLLESFEFNSIDYVLKPVTADKLRQSLTKLKRLEKHFRQTNPAALRYTSDQPDRIVVKKGSEFVVLLIENIAYFYTQHRIVFAREFSGKNYITDKTLADLETQLKGTHFFRINRKYIANINAIEKFKSDNGKVNIVLKPSTSEEVFVSKESAGDFRRWIGK